MELQVGVKAFLKNKQGKYLLVHRSNKKYPDVSGRWDIVGGRIKPGVGLKENLEREVEEETKLKLESEPRLIFAQDILRIPGKHVVRLTYEAESSGKVILDKEENDKYRWLSIEELRNLDDLDSYVKEIVEKWVGK